MYLSKVSEFNKILLNSSSSIGDAIKSLNRSGLKIVIILSKKKNIRNNCRWRHKKRSAERFESQG